MMLIASVVVVLILLALSGIRIIDQYERGIVLTLGSYTRTLSPGLNFVIPIFERVIKVDIRITTSDIPQQEVITKDNVPVGINAVVYFQVTKPEDAVLKIQDYTYAVTQYAQTALRDVIGGVELDSLLVERQKIADEIKKIVDIETTDWGVDVTAIKIQDIELPADMKRAMAKQAEAERERRATIIRSQGELAASENLKKAMEQMASSGAISIRTLQTIEATTANPASTVVFALPIEVMEGLKKLTGK
ncbi:MAG: SPFH domain, Band 7 family protein [Microgenomates group bacterium GW2011_GWA2_44_7]|nr:MAG: SPFH domain, Band 7 family protein [Microgenomates group bacterium GW2011_GWA2_44_7]KKT77869.1 MAG: SPFH domain, Band 7 family protein [Microgenomates group bacterium GW2011_GWB1_44_8]